MVSNRGSNCAVVRPVAGSVDQLPRPPSERGAIRVAVDECLEDLRKSQTGSARRGLQGTRSGLALRNCSSSASSRLIRRAARSRGVNIARTCRGVVVEFRSTSHVRPLVQGDSLARNPPPAACLPPAGCDRRHRAATGRGVGADRHVKKSTGLRDQQAIRQATTWIGSPTLTLLKYHAALSGLRLMHP